MADATVTRYELSLGAQDATTGWPAPDYSTTYEIEGSMQPRGFAFPLAGGGFDVAKYAKTFYTADVIARGDLIKDKFNRYYAITTAEPFDWFDQFDHYQCAAEQREPFAAPTTTSGTWHLDSDSLKTDPRWTHKNWLDTYLTADNMELDNGATNADVRTMFAGIPYYCPMEQLFLTEGYDGIMSIDKRSAQQLPTYNHYPYSFLETVPIHCSAIDKSGLTATNLLEQMEQEIRHVCTDHPLGSIRSIDSTEYKSMPLGGTRLWETTVTIRYKRANDDYVPSYPTLTWGPSAAPSGTFTFPNVTNIDFLDENGDVFQKPPIFTGQLRQAMGDEPVELELTCDLDIEPSAKTWKRPQTTTPKTDKHNWQVFRDIKHNAGIDQAYQTFNLNGHFTFKVNLISAKPQLSGDGNVITVRLREYRATSASGETYTTRLGIS